MTITRYFGGFRQRQVEALSSGLWGLLLAPRLHGHTLGMVLDLDSTVLERYGHQEGSLKGHNPRKHGRPSHHPIRAVLADVRWIVHAWLRSGNTGTARGVRAFLTETLARLPERVRLDVVRADSGLFEREFLEDLESRALPYAIAVRMTKPIQHQAAAIRSWRSFGHGLEVGEMAYTAPSWRVPRRLVVVREEIRERPDARGRRLIDVPGYTFHSVVTTLEHPPEVVWRFYNGRADSENRIKELEDDFVANGFCVQSIDGTEAVFRLICVLFNLVAAFKDEVLHDRRSRLTTLRTEVLVAGAISLSSAPHEHFDWREAAQSLGLERRDAVSANRQFKRWLEDGTWVDFWGRLMAMRGSPVANAGPPPPVSSPGYSPLIRVIRELGRAYSYFNSRFFGGLLPAGVLLAIEPTPPGRAGYHSAYRWHRDGESISHIGIAESLLGNGSAPALETLFQEIVNLRNTSLGTRARKAIEALAPDDPAFRWTVHPRGARLR